MEKKKKIQLVMGIAAVFLCGIAYLVMGPGRDGAGASAETEFIAGASSVTTGSVEVSVTGASVYVYICGEVKKPGVYTFDHDPRVVEVVDIAGGFSKKADKTSVNLAAQVSDGSQVVIPEKGKATEGSVTGTDTGQDTSGVVDINTAGAEELKQIPGIGDAKAAAIVSYRSEHGRFARIEDLMQITGIKEGIFNRIKDYIRV